MDQARDFAEVAIEYGYVTADQVRVARMDQIHSRGRKLFLGEILVQKGDMSMQQLITVLHLARGYRERSLGEDEGPRFGDVAMRKGYITPFQLFVHLQRQRDEDSAELPHRELGELLVDQGRITPWELEDVLVTLADLSYSTTRTGDTPTEALSVTSWRDGGSDESRADESSEERAAFLPTPELTESLPTNRQRHVATRRAPVVRTLVRDVMKIAVTTTPDARLGDAIDLAVEHEADALLVFHHDDLVGVLPVSELHDVAPGTPVGRVMSVPHQGVSAHVSIEEAATVMRETESWFLPVNSNGSPVGIVTREDLSRGGLPRELLGQRVLEEAELGVGD